ncbi:hypothetical protein ACIREO_34210 [Streptomyces sp. NPDC102441]|uniref:hypothetical protein n=1 Tax=Streptomyces sp. NPDC102441 TaxID=3366176 RepID=UPI00381C25C7
MRRAHRTARPALLAAAALLLSACGIPTTGVVESGEPATGIRSITTVYFLKNHVLTAVPRAVAQRAGVEVAVKTLFSGPDDSERLAGLNSGLPTLTLDPSVRIEGTRVWIELGFATRSQLSDARKRLSGTPTLSQLTCTVGRALQAEDPGIGSVSVIVMTSMGDSDDPWSTEGNSSSCTRSGRFPGAASRPG